MDQTEANGYEILRLENALRIAEAFRRVNLSDEERAKLEEEQRENERERQRIIQMHIEAIEAARRANGLGPLGSDGPALVTIHIPGTVSIALFL